MSRPDPREPQITGLARFFVMVLVVFAVLFVVFVCGTVVASTWPI